jgi:YbbR domain-containing protein
MKERNIHIILATSFFAALLWLSVSLSDQYQVHVRVPVVVQNVPAGWAISNPLPRVVRVTFNDFGWRLAKMMWGSQLEWTIDVSLLPGRQRVLTLRDFAEQLGNRFGLQPLSMMPDSIYIMLDTVETKRIAVVPQYAATFREGYGQIGPVLVFPESVTVSGARRIVRPLQSWPTEFRQFDKLRQPVDLTVPLAESPTMLVFTPDNVRLKLDVQQFAEKTFAQVPLELTSVPPHREVLLSSPHVDIVVRGGIEQLATVQASSIHATIDYRVLVADTSGTVEPDVKVPPGLRAVRVTPERIQYVIRRKASQEK